MVAGRRRPGVARQHPEPGRSWIVYVPRAWPDGAAPWTDLASGRLRVPPGGEVSAGEALPELDALELDDVFYLPPVAADLAPARDRWAAGLIESETPVLIQLEPGAGTEVAAASVVYDLTSSLLAGEVGRLSTLPAGSHAVWPLISGFTDSAELCDEGCDLLAGAEVATVRPVAVELTPEASRRLVELGGDGVFEAVFHGQPPSERDFAGRAAARGLGVFAPRPAVAGTARRVRNRRLAADLALAGDLWLRLGRSAADGQSLLRAARGADGTRRDLAALAREGNLDVLDWLDARSVEIVAETIAAGRSPLLESLLAEYLSDA